MDSSFRAHQAYTGTPTELRSARSLELQLFCEITSAMRALQPSNFPELAAILHRNRQLWTRLAADVADPGNLLAPKLRAQIFYLAEFTETHSQNILNDGGDIAPLLEINTAMIRGLSGTPVFDSATTSTQLPETAT